ncbi:MAG: hypothetical protein K2P04_09120 [Oscillospiraceae bacterium]|nr:hypothetical protein [Oscillospiraceae bacterium]
MYCEIKAVLSNARHPERGQVTVPFPIPQDAYEQTIEALEALGIGDALERDCRVDELDSGYPVLKRLEGTEVNVDELNYLGEWLDSEEEAAQFQDMAHKLGPFDIQDFINLTFRCGQGGAEPKRQYDGRYLPPYIHEPPVAVVEVVSEEQGETRAFCLPMSELRLQRTRLQAGADSLDTRLRLAADRIPEKVAEALDLERLSGDDLPRLNRLCQSIQPLRDKGRENLSAVTLMTETSGIVSICRLAENLDQFDFVPGVRTPEEYGRHMIQKSGHFDFDENLEGFYDYCRYGEQRIQQEGGQFNECGYVVYQGEVPLEELMRGTSEEQRQGPQMGGLSC